jgi:bifunctional ADP-heptose synthase (sugar kinase/adenylyltransferase)
MMQTEELSRFFADFGTRYSLGDVENVLESIRDLRVLVVGEAIIDEYVYCEVLGKAGKEPILAARFTAEERFVGGILAIANHVAAVAHSVTALTFLGDRDCQEEFIRREADPKVEFEFLRMRDAPTIVKRRFIESYPLQKLFELYVMNGEASDDPQQSAALIAAIERMLPDFDVVLVADYGHGMLNEAAVKVLCERSPFLAVNTQMNADNRGFNTVSKYPRADFVSASETEIRLEARSRKKDLREIVAQIAGRSAVPPKILVTRGSSGSLYYDLGHGFVDVPAFTSHAVDRIGAGDAVLAVTALCVARQAPAEVTAAIGNAVGAQAVGWVGNRRAVDPELIVQEFASQLSA